MGNFERKSYFIVNTGVLYNNKIPVFKDIGDKGFIIFVFLCTRQNAVGKCYITLNMILSALQWHRKYKNDIVAAILKLHEHKLIQVLGTLSKDTGNDEEITIEICDAKAFAKIYEEDWDLYRYLGLKMHCVYLCILMFYNHSKKCSYPSIRYLSKITGFSPTTIQNYINQLSGIGLMNIVTGDLQYSQELGKLVQENNEYRLNLEARRQILDMSVEEFKKFNNIG